MSCGRSPEPSSLNHQSAASNINIANKMINTSHVHRSVYHSGCPLEFRNWRLTKACVEIKINTARVRNTPRNVIASPVNLSGKACSRMFIAFSCTKKRLKLYYNVKTYIFKKYLLNVVVQQIQILMLKFQFHPMF